MSSKHIWNVDSSDQRTFALCVRPSQMRWAQKSQCHFWMLILKFLLGFLDVPSIQCCFLSLVSQPTFMHRFLPISECLTFWDVDGEIPTLHKKCSYTIRLFITVINPSPSLLLKERLFRMPLRCYKQVFLSIQQLSQSSILLSTWNVFTHSVNLMKVNTEYINFVLFLIQCQED